MRCLDLLGRAQQAGTVSSHRQQPPPPPPPNSREPPRPQALAAVQLQAQREMAERMIATCFERCVSEPDARLTDKQRRCLDMCAGGFLEGYTLAVRAWL